MRTLNRLASMAVGAAIASATPAHAAPAKYWVLIATRNADISVQEKVEVFDRAWPCGYMPKMELSAKFPAFVAGYQAFVVGPYDVKQDAEQALGKLRPCFADARVKFTEYRNDYAVSPAPAPVEKKPGATVTNDSKLILLQELEECINGAVKHFYTQAEPATVVATAALAMCYEEVSKVKEAYGFSTTQATEDAIRPDIIAKVMAFRAIKEKPAKTSSIPSTKEYIQ